MSINNERWVYQHGNHSKLVQLAEFVMLGYDRFTKATPLSDHIHEQDYEMVYIEQGAVNWEVNGESYHTRAQQLFRTWPGERHRASFNYIEPCTIWWIIIKDPIRCSDWFSLKGEEREQFNRILQQQPRIISVDRAIAASFRHLRRIIESTEITLLEYQVRHYILDILLQLVRSSLTSNHSPDIHDFTISLASRIEANPALRLSTEQLAATFGLSESHFYRVFRETNGISPASYMERVRMDCACRILLESSTSITDIALDLGFKTSQHFATVFKKYIGMTPKAWRLMHKS